MPGQWHHITGNMPRRMLRTRLVGIFYGGILVPLLALCVFFALPAAADSPLGEQPTKSEWSAPYPYPIGAGIQGLAAGSTDIIVADVIEANPRPAIEGARDNAKLKVVQVLMGRPVVGETLDLYYHLLWIDEQSLKLEPPKFEQGKRYVIFLRSYIQSDPQRHGSVEYELSDQWLSVMHPRPDLLNEIASAIRVAHGDARGEWSPSVAAYQGRLVTYRNKPINQTPIITLFLDLHNVTGGQDTSEFELSRATITWNVTDENGKSMAPSAVPGGEPEILFDQKTVLESGGTARLALSQTGAAVPKNRRGYLSIVPGKAWAFERSDKGVYFLSCKIEMPFRAANVWYGTLDLPKMAIPLD